MTKRQKALRLALGLKRFHRRILAETPGWGLQTYQYVDSSGIYSFGSPQAIYDMALKVARSASVKTGLARKHQKAN